MHRHGVKRESDIKIKWRFKNFRFVELSQNTIIKDFGRISVNFGVFWHPFFTATGPNELNILLKLL